MGVKRMQRAKLAAAYLLLALAAALGWLYSCLPVTNAEGHGIGVRSICAIVEKYKGLSDFSVQDGRFILRVSL